jgi:hypothetical protein
LKFQAARTHRRFGHDPVHCGHPETAFSYGIAMSKIPQLASFLDIPISHHHIDSTERIHVDHILKFIKFSIEDVTSTIAIETTSSIIDRLQLLAYIARLIAAELSASSAL